MSDPQHHLPDSRAYGQQLERELVLGGVLIGAVVGIGGVYLIWGQTAGITALVCFVLFLFIVGLLWGLLTLMGRISERD